MIQQSIAKTSLGALGSTNAVWNKIIQDLDDNKSKANGQMEYNFDAFVEYVCGLRRYACFVFRFIWFWGKVGRLS